MRLLAIWVKLEVGRVSIHAPCEGRPLTSDATRQLLSKRSPGDFTNSC